MSKAVWREEVRALQVIQSPVSFFKKHIIFNSEWNAELFQALKQQT